MTKDIKGNHKNYSVTKKSGIKRDIGRKNMGRIQDHLPGWYGEGLAVKPNFKSVGFVLCVMEITEILDCANGGEE